MLQYKQELQRFLGMQNIILTLYFYFSNLDITSIKTFQFFKLTTIILYRNYHYLKKGKPYYLIELCYILLLTNWLYLLFDLYILDEEYRYYKNLFYNTIYPFSAIILPLASAITKDTFTIRKLIANTRTLVHIENGAFFLILQNHNIKNGINTSSYGYTNMILSIIFYYSWLTIYNKIMTRNILSYKPDPQNMVTKFTDNNLMLYNLGHSFFNMTAIILSYWIFYNYYLQIYVFGLGYLTMSFHTAISKKG